ncbi:uncharacterized protein V1518DRAFT_412896 [Limtongia smithiae]|uniref:uncharacterized protein n=1 Tax=Limtongia smithiae TaxID=1125753 RepID=UPI0034D00F01
MSRNAVFFRVLQFLLLLQLCARQVAAIVYNLGVHGNGTGLDNTTYTYSFTVQESLITLITGGASNISNASYPSDLGVVWTGTAYDHLVYITDLVLDVQGEVQELIENYTLAFYLGDLAGISDEDYVLTYNGIVADVNTYTSLTAAEISSESSSVALLRRADTSTKCSTSHKVIYGVCAGFFAGIAAGIPSYGFKRGEQSPRSYCRKESNGYGSSQCCVSWSRNVSVTAPFFSTSWTDCKWRCFDADETSQKSCEIVHETSGLSKSSYADVCYSNRPTGCT